MNVQIRKAEMADLPVIAGLACRLWPDHTAEEMAGEMESLLSHPDAVLFLACEGWDNLGFVQCQLRRDYVEGTETSPVGYLEGIYVEPSARHRGIARQLLGTCERWAAHRGCREFASDCELDNLQSQAFHARVGFVEANRIICFAKKL